MTITVARLRAGHFLYKYQNHDDMNFNIDSTAACPLCSADLPLTKTYYIKVYVNGRQTPANERTLVVSEAVFNTLHKLSGDGPRSK